MIVNMMLFFTRSQHNISPSTWAVAREIVKTQGLGFRGLNKGVTATIGRNGLFNMVYFGLFHTVNTRITQPKVRWQYCIVDKLLSDIVRVR